MVTMNPILCEVLRDGRHESCHRGTLVVLQGNKEVAALGDATTLMYPRSALKPLQAVFKGSYVIRYFDNITPRTTDSRSLV